jgi:group I intron endonuclease
MNRTVPIYNYTNKINGKVYIGQTKTTLEHRHKKHLSQLNDDTYLHRAIKKYGIENFQLEVVEDNILLSNLDNKEIFYIEQFQSYYTSGLGYNLTKGGQWSTPCQKLYGNQETEIKKLIVTTNLSFREIGERFEVSVYCISDINRGKTFYNSNLEYPLRKSHKKSQISEKIVDEILDLLKNTNMTAKEISEQFGIHEYTVGQINRGKNSMCPKIYKYPIRNWEKSYTYNNKVSKEDVIDICYNLIFSDKKYSDISKEFEIAKNTVGDISRGLTWKEITKNFKCPIKKNKLYNQKIFNEIYGIV